MNTDHSTLLTGAGGFFGRHIATALGSRVLAPGRSDLDLLDDREVTRYLSQHRPGAIVHAAGFVGGIGLNKAHPGRMATENLRMGLNLLEASARIGGIHVVIISTICVYPGDAPVPTREDQIWHGYPAAETAPYGLAKRELLSVAEALRAEFDLGYSYLIPTNLYGPGDHFEPEKSHVVPALIERFHTAASRGDERVVVWGDGTATRDLLYVEDAAQGVAAVARGGPFPFPMNLGSGREMPIRELAEAIAAATGFRGTIEWDATKPAGAPRRALDATLAFKTIGFEPRVGLDEGLRRSIAWWLAQGEATA